MKWFKTFAVVAIFCIILSGCQTVHPDGITRRDVINARVHNLP